MPCASQSLIPHRRPRPPHAPSPPHPTHPTPPSQHRPATAAAMENAANATNASLVVVENLIHIAKTDKKKFAVRLLATRAVRHRFARPPD